MQVAVNYAKYVVDIALGYYLGQPVKYDANPVDELGRKVELAPLLRCYERGTSPGGGRVHWPDNGRYGRLPGAVLRLGRQRSHARSAGSTPPGHSGL